jgi:hypothetical protein
MEAKNLFFILASVLVVLVIIQFASNLYGDKEEKQDPAEVVYLRGGFIPWGRPFWRRPFWRRPGGYYVGPYDRRYRLGRRRR